MSTHTTPPSWLSRLFRSPICRRSPPEGDTSRMSTSLTTLEQPLDHHTGPRILARPDGDTQLALAVPAVPERRAAPGRQPRDDHGYHNGLASPGRHLDPHPPPPILLQLLLSFHPLA